MLVVTRKAGESIKVGQDIVVTILSSTRNRVEVGIEAPRNVPIVRIEINENGHDDRSQATGDDVDG